jgi:hypothetical protein
MEVLYLLLHNFARTADRRNIAEVSIATLPEEILLDIFALHMPESYDDRRWENLVHVCRRWRSVVFAAPRRLNLQLVCTSGTPARKMLDIWPALPISIRVYGIINNNILAAFEEHDRICEVRVTNVSDLELKSLVGAMQVPFPALTDLSIHSCGNTVSFSRSFLGGSAPNLWSLDLTGIAFRTLPKLLLSSPGLVHLALSNIPHSGYASSDAVVDFLTSLARLESLEINFPSTKSRRAQASRHPAPLTRVIFPILRSLDLRGEKEYLEQILSHIAAPALNSVDIRFFDPTIFDISRISQWNGRTEMFEAFDQAYMVFDSDYFYVMLSSRKGTTGGKMLRLLLLWVDSGWKLHELNLDSRECFFEPFDLCKVERSQPPNWAEDMDNAPWLHIVRLFTATEYIYLSQGVAVRVVPALQELIGERVATVLPVLRSIFVQCLDGLGPVQEAIGQFVTARQLLSGHPVDVQCWVKGEKQ